jgi:hypothetical protein
MMHPKGSFTTEAPGQGNDHLAIKIEYFSEPDGWIGMSLYGFSLLQGEY